MNTSSNSEKTSDITSPPTENHPFGFGAGSGSRFDFFGSGGMFGGNNSQETGNNAEFSAFNFTGLDSINRTGGNDLGGFGFNFWERKWNIEISLCTYDNGLKQIIMVSNVHSIMM